LEGDHLSDLYLQPTVDGGELIVSGGNPQTTSGLGNAVYLALFTEAWWGNSVSDAPERFTSELPEIMTRTLSNQTRLAAQDAIENALQWMIDAGIVEELEVTAEIPSAGRLNIAIALSEPGGASVDFVYAVNWDAQEASLL
jgi:phage gp46-like protein